MVKNKFFLIFFSIFYLLPNFTFAVVFEVTDYVGETWFANPNEIIGKEQMYHKGYAEGVFYSCDFAGQSFTNTSYTREEFLENKEFILFKKHNIEFNNSDIVVYRITCNGENDSDRRVLYPFVRQDRGNIAYYLFEGAIYTLEEIE